MSSQRRKKTQPSVYDRINIAEPDEHIIEGYVPSAPRRLIYWTLCILSFGILYFATAWKPSIRIKATHVKASLEIAQTVLLTVSFRNNHCPYCVISEPQAS